MNIVSCVFILFFGVGLFDSLNASFGILLFNFYIIVTFIILSFPCEKTYVLSPFFVSKFVL